MRIGKLACITLLTGGMMVAAHSQAADLSCSDINFTGPVVSEFPAAKDFCLDVAERDGKAFALFRAEVRRVRGNTVHMRFKHPDGSFGDTVSFTPPMNFRVKIAGSSYRVRDLYAGQELNVWLPEDEWELVHHETPEELIAAESIETFAISDSDEDAYTASATLPKTASLWPLTALAGSLLVMTGLLIGWYRRRYGS